VGSVVIALVLAIIGYGYYASTTPEREWVTKVRVDDTYTVFFGSDYVKTLRLCVFGLYPADSPESPLFVLENNELLRQGAIAANISATYDEVTQKIEELLIPEDGNVTQDQFEQAYQQFLNYYGLSDEEFREIMETDILREKLDQHLRDGVPQSALQVHVLGILASWDEVQTVLERLDEGDDFDSLAQEYGDGDLGWLPPGIMGEAFDQAAFALEPGEVSQPIYSEGDQWWLIQVLEREEREIEEEIREQLMEEAFGRWLEEEWVGRVERNPNLDLNAIYQWARGQI
jgi:hypothetical protein